jgi:hypothetical protein
LKILREYNAEGGYPVGDETETLPGADTLGVDEFGDDEEGNWTEAN